MLLHLLLIAAGFVFLIKGAELLIEGAASLAKKLKLSDLAIGLTIVAFGTSSPELFINLISNFKNSTDLAIGNVIGANIINLLLATGLAAAIHPIRIRLRQADTEILLGLSALILLFLLSNDFFMSSGDDLLISRWDGAGLLFLFLVFLYYTFGLKRSHDEASEQTPDRHHFLSLAYVIAGIAGLIVGGNWVVTGAVILANQLHLSPSIIGLTIVSLGSTLPELAASAMAAWKKNADLAIGNIIGSIIFNIFFILGLNALLKPLPFNPQLNFDLVVAMAATCLLFYFILIGRRRDHIERWECVILILIYLGYLGALIFKQ